SCPNQNQGALRTNRSKRQSGALKMIGSATSPRESPPGRSEDRFVSSAASAVLVFARLRSAQPHPQLERLLHIAHGVAGLLLRAHAALDVVVKQVDTYLVQRRPRSHHL